MSIRKSAFALAATFIVAASILVPSGASAFSRGGHVAAPVRVTISAHATTLGWGSHYGYGYGRGWCYWHPYACYYRNR